MFALFRDSRVIKELASWIFSDQEERNEPREGVKNSGKQKGDRKLDRNFTRLWGAELRLAPAQGDKRQPEKEEEKEENHHGNYRQAQFRAKDNAK